MSDIRSRLQETMDADQYQRTFGNLKKKESKKGRKYEEDSLQSACVKLWAIKYPDLIRVLFMVNNSGFKQRIETKQGKSISLQAIRDKRMGLVKGVSDLILWIPNGLYNAAALEMKTEIGQQSLEQELFQAYCGIMNYEYMLIRSVNEFEAQIDNYMKSVDRSVINQIKHLTDKYNAEVDRKILNKVDRMMGR